MSSASPHSWQDPYTVRLDRADPHVRLHCSIIYVSNQDRSIQFFVEQLGFRLVLDVPLGPNFRWIEVAPPDGSALLALVERDPKQPQPQVSGHVVFVTEDVVAKYNEWSARGVRFQFPPRRPAWSPNAGTTTVFEDPDGNTFSLINFDEITRDIENRRRALQERLEAERRAALELQIAKDVQAKLFPQQSPSMRTLEYAGLCIQARQVGGDYYDFIDLGRDRLGLIIGDISGKGIAAALLMANLQANLRSQCAGALNSPYQFLTSVNRLFHENTHEASYATLFYGEYDDHSRKLRYANCGHLAALALKRDGRLERLESTCTVLGLFSEWDCNITEYQFAPGDTLALYTDGVTEACNATGEEFGEERLVRALQGHSNSPAHDLLQAVTDAARSFSPREQQDDITLIIAKCV